MLSKYIQEIHKWAPHSIVKNIFEAHSISAKHSTIEEILKEVEYMETAQKTINLLMRMSYGSGGRSSQAKSQSHDRKS